MAYAILQQQAERDGASVAGKGSLQSDLLVNIGEKIHNHDQCLRLAVKLNLSEDIVLKVLAAKFTNKLPFEILSRWNETEALKVEDASCVLHVALCAIERNDLADSFWEKLGSPCYAANHESVAEHATQAQAVQAADAELTDTTQTIPPLNLLLDIASLLPKRDHCVRLANQLGLAADFVDQVRAGRFTTGVLSTPLNILCKWTQLGSTEATGQVLYDALVAIQRPDVAACFSRTLCGRDVENWKVLCYDDEHRNFFRILQEHVDVVAVYERMQCSADFLSVLQRNDVLSHAEYNEFICDASQSPQRLALVNKKLLDVINQKPPQVQTLFSSLLHCHQPQLAEPEGNLGSTLSGDMVNDALVNTQWRLHGEELLADIQQALKRRFNQLLLARPLDYFVCEDYQPVSELYVTLSSISYEEALRLIGGTQQRSSRDLVRAARQVDAESKHSHELYNLHSLLCYPQGQKARSALLFGSPGSGKSLTTLKILSEWKSECAESPFQEFDMIVYVPGRERFRLSTDDMRDLWQLNRMGYNRQQEDVILHYYSKNSEKILFLIDGWDETGDDSLLWHGAALMKVLHGELYEHSSVIITSRPSPNSYPLLKVCQRRYSLVGFNNERLRELFRRRLEEPQASRLFDTLSQSSHLHVKSAVQKTPLFAAMLVQLYKMEEALPNTITALYQSMLDGVCKRYVQRVKKTQAGGEDTLVAFGEAAIEEAFDKAEAKLGSLALFGLMENQVTFSYKEVKSCGEAVIKPQFGLLSEAEDTGICHRRVLYHFNHLTWQEYLAARSLASTDDPDFIRKLKASVELVGVAEHTHLFWQFVSGLVNPHLLPALVFELAKAKDVSGYAPWETDIRLFLMHCIAESVHMRAISTTNYAQLAAEVITAQDGQVILNACSLDGSHLASLVIFLQACKNVTHLTLVEVEVNWHYTALSGALDNLQDLILSMISGQASTSFLADAISSLTRSSVISYILCYKIAAAEEWLSAIAWLINSSQSLSSLTFDGCEIGKEGMGQLSRSVLYSSSLSMLIFENDDLASTGKLLGQMCAHLPGLALLKVANCGLIDTDVGDILDPEGLLKSSSLGQLQITKNKITDDVAGSLRKFADDRAKLALSCPARLPLLRVYMSGNDISENMLTCLAAELPANCRIAVTNGVQCAEHGVVQEVDHAAEAERLLRCSTDSHLQWDEPGCGDHGAIQIAALMTTSRGQQLISVCLHACDLGDNGARVLAAALPKCRVQGLDLFSNLLTIHGFYHLLRAVCESGKDGLRYLNVGQNPIFASSGLCHGQLTPSILELSQRVQSLEIVSVTSTGFSDESSCFENSPLALLAIPSLSALDLSNNEITNKSVAVVTRWMDKLMFLSLSGNRITSDGGRQLIENAQMVLNTCIQQQSTCCLRQIWLGGNIIEESVFADCSCEVISSQCMCIRDILPEFVLDLFPALKANSMLSSQLLFWGKMNAVACSEAFHDYMKLLCAENKRACLSHYLTLAFEALAYHTSNYPVRAARALLDSLLMVYRWYDHNETNRAMALAVLCCVVCITNELVLTFSMSALQSYADDAMQKISELSLLDDVFYLALQNFSTLFECCRRRQLDAVINKLQEQVESLLTSKVIQQSLEV